jgi:choline dehydrogenase-like flavoprotein
VSSGIRPIDVIVVGSGASAVNAAYPLARAGLQVRMLDLGHRDLQYAPRIPDRSFSEIRKTDPNQRHYFLGEGFCGIGFGNTGAGAQLTPPRQFVCRDTETLTPADSAAFFPIESLARGGLAAAWGAGCPPFSDADLAGVPVSRSQLEPHYETVAERIGVSGARDELLPFMGDLRSMQPPVEIDTNAETILARYSGRRERLNRAGFFLGRPRLAMLSRDHRDRRAQRYQDMDFWSDAGRSVYRPQWTLDELCRFENFEYAPGLLVDRFDESANGRVEILARRPESGEVERHTGHRAILAAGTLGTARIVLRSLGRYNCKVPLVCNPHTYVAMLNLSMLGRRARDERHSLAQLCVVHAPDGPGAPTTVAHLYSYRSLHLYRLAKDSPLPLRESLLAFRMLVSCLTLLVVQHADAPDENKSCSLTQGVDGAVDRLRIDYATSAAQREAADRSERAILSGFRSLRCLPLRRMHPGDAASVHYAGTFPMTPSGGDLTCELDGRLRGTESVHLADGSLFARLPSAGLTFTMMANANRIGEIIRDDLVR